MAKFAFSPYGATYRDPSTGKEELTEDKLAPQTKKTMKERVARYNKDYSPNYRVVPLPNHGVKNG